MKKKIVILGSTGSIGKTLIDILKKDKKKFEVLLLTTNKNYKEIYKQAKFFKVKDIIITNKKSYELFKRRKMSYPLNIYNNFNDLNKILKKKADYTMSSISGLDGLEPTLKIISRTKTIAIANKESIICGWNLIKKQLKKYKANFIPVDSEHFSIWSLIKDQNYNMIDKIFITASGGPFLNWPINKIKKVTPADALKHPNWSMGKKISIDSATMMNKVFEVIETQRIFNLSKNKIKILIHEKSYVHAIVQFKNGIKKILVHDTNMRIPIFNTLYQNEDKSIKFKELDIQKLNNLNFKKIINKQFPLSKILDNIPNKNSLFDTIVISSNDEFVNLFLNNKISYVNFCKKLKDFINLKEFHKFKKIEPKKIADIYSLRDYVSLKINSLGI